MVNRMERDNRSKFFAAEYFVAPSLSFSVMHVIFDAIALFLAFTFAYLLRFKSGIPVPLGYVPFVSYVYLWLISQPLWWFIFAFYGLYFSRLRETFVNELSKVLPAVSLGAICTMLLSFLIRGLPESRLTFLFQFTLAFLLIAFSRSILRLLERKQIPRVMIFGDSPVIEVLRTRLSRRYGPKLELIFLSQEDLRLKVLSAHGSKEVLVTDLCKQSPSEIICVSNVPKEITEALMELALGGITRVRFIPAGEALFMGTAHLSPEYGLPEVSPKSLVELYAIRRAKRVLDVFLGFLLLLLFSPVFGAIAFFIWLTSQNGVFFVQERITVAGRKFRLLKFRTMREGVVLSEELETKFREGFKLKDDPRVTPLGRWLRKTSLDELPQLLNVLRGEMSLVGPRPIVEEELEKYGVWKNVLLALPPGLTGLWQVSGRSELSYAERIDLDVYYVMNWSPTLDLSIILRTFIAIFTGRGAY